ncbi:MAG: EAL domain-containing protein [Ahrensia sp.]|nr:EAL domain-containing protein [Ahrensia sp.]
MNNNRLMTRGAGSEYRQLVRSLFKDSKVLAVGIFANTCGIAMSAWATGYNSIYFLAVALLVIGVARIAFAEAFWRADEQESIDAQGCVFWERWFTIGAVSYTSILGLWCLLSNVYGDHFLQMVSASVTFANVAGIVGRSYPLKRLVDLQLASIAVLALAGMVWTGGYYALLAILLLPFIAGLSGVATWQREMLLGNIIERRNAEKLATQLHTTLDNVPQGVCMFDAEGRLEVSNRHVLRVLQRSWREVKGAKISDLINHMFTELGLPENEAERFRKWEQQSLNNSFTMNFQLQTDKTRHYRFLSTPMDNGGLVFTIEDITNEIETASRIDYMSRFDRLTGLMNRDYLAHCVEQCVRGCPIDEYCAVILFNLHRFKLVNDVHGHHIGDELLHAVAERLKDLVGDNGQCARFGGDEFAVIVVGPDAPDLARDLADRISEDMSKTFTIEGRAHQIGCSVGLSFLRGRDGISATELMKQADLALQWAREDGGGTWQQFNRKMMRELEQKQRLESDLRDAVANEELDIHYQPIAELDGRRVVVCEALMRWKHKKLGMIPPATFIPIAERLGLIDQMGAWLLRKACQDCSHWPEHVAVAVNLSPYQFTLGNIDQQVFDALKASGLAPHRLELEITESSMLDDIDDAIAKLHGFKKIGVSVALDDFGTGYSSLSYMSRLPVDKLKIDRSFVSDMAQDEQSLTLMKAIVQMGRFLGLTVVAEGVETFAELNMLRRYAPVDLVQGYLFSHPLPLSQLPPLLEDDSVQLEQIRSHIPVEPPKVA